MDRDLMWDGCLNVRDLGGFRTADGRITRRGAVVRSDNPAYLTPAGWAALHEHGVRTIVALRTVGATDDEADEQLVPDDITIERVFVEDGTDAAFVERCVVNGLFGTPLYFREMLDRWPDRCALAVGAVANARPGGVVIACGRGCDRTGLAAFLLLGLVGVAAADIAADWAMSVDRLRPRDPTYEAALDDLLRRHDTTVLAAVTDALASSDIRERLLAGGLTEIDVAAVETRLIGP